MLQRMSLVSTDPDPWARGVVNLWRNQDLNPHQFAAHQTLIQEQEKEHKLQDAIQRGRVYGLGSAHYEHIRKQRLEAVLNRRPQGNKLW